MCEPTSLIMLATTVASSVAGVVAQTSAANSQAEFVQQQHDVQTDEANEKAEIDMIDRSRQATREQAQARTDAAGSGLNLQSGSVEALLQDSMMQESMDNAATLKKNQNSRRAITTNANSEMNKIEKPTALGAALKIGGSTYKAYNSDKEGINKELSNIFKKGST